MTSTASWQLAARHLALDAATVSVVRILGDAGVSALLLKGPVTASRLYADEPYRRCYGDADLLVSPLEFDRAEAALEAAGCRRANPGLRTSEIGWQETSWLAPGSDRLAIDLHRTFHRVHDAEDLWDSLWESRESMTLQGVEVAVPDRVGSALLVALHASSPGSSRQPYRDLARAVEVFTDDEWRAAVDLARRVGADDGVAAGFAAVPAARQLMMRFDLAYSRIPMAMRMYTPDISPAGMAIYRFLNADDFRTRLKYLVSRAIPSEASMRKNWTITSHSTWGLVKAHRQRYLRVLLSLPEGFAELFRASRSGSAARPTWAEAALGAVRDQLAHGGLDDVDLVAPRTATRSRQVARMLRRGRASCLERSLVWQRFYASRGDARCLVIGVSQPGATFHAHAWLEGDRQDDDTLFEILRRPVPMAWMGQS